MALMDQINTLVEAEVKSRVETMMHAYAKTISETCKISLPLLIRYMPTAIPEDNTLTFCIGVKRGNVRCTMVGKFEGYCRHHYAQKKQTAPIKIIEHNDVVTAPAFRKPLIDFKLM